MGESSVNGFKVGQIIKIKGCTTFGKIVGTQFTSEIEYLIEYINEKKDRYPYLFPEHKLETLTDDDKVRYL